MKGNVTSRSLVVAEGAVFSGQSIMEQAEPAAPPVRLAEEPAPDVREDPVPAG